MLIDKDRADIVHLTGLLCEGIIAADELARLEALLLGNAEAQRLYHQLAALRVDLTWTPIGVAPAAPVVVPVRRVAWRKWLATGAAVGAAMAAAILLAVWLLVPPASDDAPLPRDGALAQVVALYGEAKIVSATGDMLPLSEGQEVAPGQIISTGQDSSLVTLEYPDATRLILGADTLAQLPAVGAEREFGAGPALAPGLANPPSTGRRVFLFKGFLRAELPVQDEPAGDALVLASAHAEVAAAASQVNFWTSAAETRVESERGRVKLTRRADRHVVDVLTNSYIVVTPEQPELKSRPMPAATKPRRVFREGTGPVVSLAFAPDGAMLAVGGWKGQVQFLDVESGKPARPPLQAAKKTIRALAFSPDRRTLATAADEKERLKLWDLAGDGPPRVVKAQRTVVRGLVFAGDPARLASGAGNNKVGKVRLWNPHTGASIANCPATACA